MSTSTRQAYDATTNQVLGLPASGVGMTTVDCFLIHRGLFNLYNA